MSAANISYLSASVFPVELTRLAVVAVVHSKRDTGKNVCLLSFFMNFHIGSTLHVLDVPLYLSIFFSHVCWSC